MQRAINPICVVLWFVLATLSPQQADAIVDMKNANFSESWQDFPPLKGSNSARDSDKPTLNSISHLALQRTYNSRSQYDGIFGFGWCTSLETALEITAEGNLTLSWCGGGMKVSFLRQDFTDTEPQFMTDQIVDRLRTVLLSDPTGLSAILGGFDQIAWSQLHTQLLKSDGERARWARHLGIAFQPRESTRFLESGKGVGKITLLRGQYIYEPGNGRVLRFDSHGNLLEEMDAQGQRLSVLREAGRIVRVETGDSGWIEFQYYETTKVASLRRSDGAHVNYAYSPSGDLIRVKNAWGNEYKYQYDDLHNLIQIDYPDGTYRRLGYDKERDWVISYRNRTGCIEDYTYALYSQAHYWSRVVKNCDGKTTHESTYEFFHRENTQGPQRLYRTITTLNSAVVDTIYEETFGKPVQITRGSEQTRFLYHPDGRLWKRTHGNKLWEFFYDGESLTRTGVVEYEMTDTQEVVGRTELATDPWMTSVTSKEAQAAILQAESTLPDPTHTLFSQQRSKGDYSAASKTLGDWDDRLRRGKDEKSRVMVAQLALILGVELANKGPFDTALTLLARAFLINEQLGREEKYQAVEWMAKIHIHEKRFAEAEEILLKAISSLEKERRQDTPRFAAFLEQLGNTYRWIGRYGRAIELLERAHALGYGKAVGSAVRMADVYGDVGLFEQQLKTYRSSMQALQAALDPSANHDIVSDIASSLSVLGRYEEALALTERQIVAAKKMPGDPARTARLLIKQGIYLTWLNQYDKALGVLEDARSAIEGATEINEHVLSDVLDALGALYGRLGRTEQEITLHEGAYALTKKLGAREVDLRTDMSNLAVAYRNAGRYTEAMDLFREAYRLDLKYMPAGHWLAGVRLFHMGETHRLSGAPDAALSVLEESAAILEKALGQDSARLARVHVSLGQAQLALHRRDNAIDSFARALDVAIRSRNAEAIWPAQDGLRQALAGLHPELAIFFGKSAVSTIQGLRTLAGNLDGELKKSFLNSKSDAYRGVADLLIDKGRLPEAQQILRMLKEEEYFDFVRRDEKRDHRSADVSFNVGETAWQGRYSEISGNLGTLGRELAELDRKARIGLSESESKRREQLRSDRRVARQAFDAFLGEFMRELSNARQQRNLEVGKKALENLTALQGTLGSLGHNTVAVHFLMGEERLRILLTTPSVQIARSSAVGASELNRKIAFFQSQLQDPQLNPLPMARELYRLLIAPIADDLAQSKAETLMVSLDGTLRYIPLAALHDGKRYLVETYRIAIFTEAARDKLRDIPQPVWRVAAMGLTQAKPGFSALPAVRDELEGIIRSGGRGVLSGEMHLDENFTAQRMRAALDKGYPVLHVASHFKFQPGTEADSFLLLGDGSRLTLKDIKNDDYRFNDVDLMTLSACETAVGGGEDANGFEIEGFGALVQRQGAKSVVATLWPVADESTGILMRTLYQLRESQGLTKAEALRRAQRSFLEGRHIPMNSGTARGLDAAQPPKPARDYTHPYYWAPFILMGNWL